MRGAALGLGRLPPRVQCLLSCRRAVVVDGQRLDPHVQVLLALRRVRGSHGLVEPSVAAGRARYRRECESIAPQPTPVAAVRELRVPGASGELDARLYTSPLPGPRPLTLFLHGGGFVIGGLDTHDEPCRVICAESGSQVLSLAYRLAPEHPFPAGLRDVEAVLRWAREHASGLGAEPGRIAVGGDSAGGNLAAAACLELRGDEASPVAQLLIYPAVDSVTRRPSQRWFDRGYFLSQADRDAFSRHYLTGTGITDAHPLVSPLLAEDLSGLPPALVVTAGFDLLRDEGVAFAERLAAEGTPSELMRVDALGHGFIHLSGVNRAAHQATVGLARRWGALLGSIPGSSSN